MFMITRILLSYLVFGDESLGLLGVPQGRHWRGVSYYWCLVERVLADSEQFYSLKGYEYLFSLTAFYFLCSAVSLPIVVTWMSFQIVQYCIQQPLLFLRQEWIEFVWYIPYDIHPGLVWTSTWYHIISYHIISYHIISYRYHTMAVMWCHLQTYVVDADASL